MNKEISPEERLFNAIHHGKNIPPRKPEEKEALESKSLWQKLTSGLFVTNFSGKGAGGSGADFQDQSLSIKSVKRILAAVLTVLILAIVYKVVYERQQIPKLTQVDPMTEHSIALVESGPVEEFQTLEYYTEDIKNKNIFHPPIAEPVVEVQEVPEETEIAGPKIQDMIQSLSLGGIYEGENLEAIIEDKELKKTYFLKSGDEIKGMKIKAILKDRVIFQLGDQEADLL